MMSNDYLGLLANVLEKPDRGNPDYLLTVINLQMCHWFKYSQELEAERDQQRREISALVAERDRLRAELRAERIRRSTLQRRISRAMSKASEK